MGGVSRIVFGGAMDSVCPDDSRIGKRPLPLSRDWASWWTRTQRCYAARGCVTNSRQAHLSTLRPLVLYAVCFGASYRAHARGVWNGRTTHFLKSGGVREKWS